MPDSSELLSNIVHYQKSLARYTESRNDTKILHCIFKLFNMPVTMSHLEKTGIGRTINSLRKLGGEVGDAANTLVKKWKDMVSKKNDDEESEENVNEPDSTQESQSYRYESNSSHKHSDKSKTSERKVILDRNDKHKSNKKDKCDEYNHSSNSDTKQKFNKRNKESKDRSSCDSDNNDSESGVSLDSDNSSSESEKVEPVTHSKDKHDKNRKYDRKHTEYKESSSERSSKHKRDSDKDRKHERSHLNEKRKHDSDNDRKGKRHNNNSSDSNEKVSKHSSNSTGKSSSKRKHEGSSSEEENKSKILKKSSHNSSKDRSSRDHKKGSRSESDNEISFRDTHKSTSHKNKDNSSREYKPESAKKENRSSSMIDSKSEKEKEDSSRENRSKSSDKSKKENSSKKDRDRKSDNKEKSRSKSSSKSSTSSNTSSSNNSNKIVNIGSESGTSFAEALGMLEPKTSKASNIKKSKSSEINHKMNISLPEKNIKEKSIPEKASKSDKIDILVPPPPKNDIDLNIASLLPPITPNYKPIGIPFFDSINRNKVMNDDEALSLVMTQKNQRTKVFSGNKCFFGKVPTLFELCIRILQDNIDAFEYTGGVPYSILKPVLDKATPVQLFVLEHHNPYLIEDSDEIWQFHCQKEFRNKKREELESWREMYMRCLDEREAKLKALTENIKLAQDKSIPVRQTKLAYVDSVVKPPRDVIRRQAKSGIDKKPIVTPSSRLNTLATSGTASQVSVPNPVKASSSGTSSAAMKPKKAPLMQKTLAFLKGNRFRR